MSMRSVEDALKAEPLRPVQVEGLEASAAEALKKFVKKNRPPPSILRSVYTSIHSSEGGMVNESSVWPGGNVTQEVDSPREEKSVASTSDMPGLGSSSSGSVGHHTPPKAATFNDAPAPNFGIFDLAGQSFDMTTMGAVREKMKLEPQLDKRLARFDIFENLDEDRIAEFESLFEKTRMSSNYDKFVKKQKEMARFATSSGVVDDKEGQRILS